MKDLSFLSSVGQEQAADNRSAVLFHLRHQSRPILRSARGGSSQASVPAPSSTASRSTRARPPFLNSTRLPPVRSPASPLKSGSCPTIITRSAPRCSPISSRSRAISQPGARASASSTSRPNARPTISAVWRARTSGLESSVSSRTPSDRSPRDTSFIFAIPSSVTVLDFGGQTAQLIVRRVRELGVYSELVPCDAPEDAVRRLDPRGLILSGGWASVYEPGAPQLPGWLHDAGLPVLGICYGMQLQSHALGGHVAPPAEREFGPATIELLGDEPLFAGTPRVQPVW